MPEGIEYLHCVQAALDADGLRYQVLDAEGHAREGLSWPLHPPLVDQWRPLPSGESEALCTGGPASDRVVALRFAGRSASAGDGSAQTLLAAGRPDLQTPLWIGLSGPNQRLTVIVGPEARRSPHYWHGPTVAHADAFRLPAPSSHRHGAGRHHGLQPATISAGSSLAAASPWGAERLAWPERWTVGHAPRGRGPTSPSGAMPWQRQRLFSRA